MEFGHVGKPFLSYTQRTRHAELGHPLHAESGYVRIAEGRAEWTIAQPTGIVEVLEGAFDGLCLDVASSLVGLTATAKRVLATRRRYEVVGDRLVYDVWMAHADQHVTHHLHAELEREA
ncbi:MAG: hypothetical protein ACI867_000300 [Glaciecola sp.]